MIMKQNKKQFIQAIFGGPTPAEGDYPSRITDEVYSALAEAGINRIFGVWRYNEPGVEEKIYELCEKYGLLYYPMPKCSDDYTRIHVGKDGEKPFGELTEAEVEELDKRFIAEIEPMTKNKAFAGVFFCDEPGYLCFDGILHAKEVYEKHFGDFEFHVNLYSYNMNDDIFWGGYFGKAPEVTPFKLEGDLDLSLSKNRFNAYNVLIDALYSKSQWEYISQDRYPFQLHWPTIPTAVHVSLFELNAFLNEKKKKYGCKFYNYMQVGQWDISQRGMSFAEMALQMHVTAAYGSEGFAYFTGCFPPCYANPRHNPNFSMIDMYGRKTIFCDWIKELNTFFDRIEDDILSSTHLGVSAYGTYRNGFTEEDVANAQWNDMIFTGELPKELLYDSGLQVESDNEVLVSTFEREGKKRYYIINLSTVYDCKATVVLPDGQYQMCAQDGDCSVSGKIEMNIPAGQGVYILEEK